MSQLPSIEPHFESPVRYLKHIQRFETDTFPDCHTVVKEWYIGKRLVNRRRHLLLVHHDPGCKYDVADVHQEGDQLRFDKLSE